MLPFQQTTDLVEKLRAQNVAFEELIIPDEIHDLLRWSDWIRAYRATAEFFDRRLAPRANGNTSDFRRPIPSKSKNIAFVLRHSFVIRHSSFELLHSKQEQERCIRASSFLRHSSFELLHSKHVLRGQPAISKQ